MLNTSCISYHRPLIHATPAIFPYNVQTLCQALIPNIKWSMQQLNTHIHTNAHQITSSTNTSHVLTFTKPQSQVGPAESVTGLQHDPAVKERPSSFIWVDWLQMLRSTGTSAGRLSCQNLIDISNMPWVCNHTKCRTTCDHTKCRTTCNHTECRTTINTGCQIRSPQAQLTGTGMPCVALTLHMSCDGCHLVDVLVDKGLRQATTLVDSTLLLAW